MHFLVWESLRFAYAQCSSSMFREKRNQYDVQNKIHIGPIKEARNVSTQLVQEENRLHSVVLKQRLVEVLW